MKIYELTNGSEASRSRIGLYATRDRAIEDAQRMLTEYIAVSDHLKAEGRDPDDEWDGWEVPYNYITWGTYEHPHLGYLEVRGRYADTSFFVLNEIGVIE